MAFNVVRVACSRVVGLFTPRENPVIPIMTPLGDSVRLQTVSVCILCYLKSQFNRVNTEKIYKNVYWGAPILQVNSLTVFSAMSDGINTATKLPSPCGTNTCQCCATIVFQVSSRRRRLSRPNWFHRSSRQKRALAETLNVFSVPLSLQYN